MRNKILGRHSGPVRQRLGCGHWSRDMLGDGTEAYPFGLWLGQPASRVFPGAIARLLMCS